MVGHAQLPKDLFAWIEEHRGLASFAGVILAIFGSVWVAGSQDRKTHRREREQQTKKAKSVAGCFVPILKIIEYDVGEILAAYSREPRMRVGELGQPQYQFRELPPFVPFVLENAHLLPDNAIIDVPQLLSLRELVANDIQTVLLRRSPVELLDNEEVRAITTWLG